MPQKVSIRGRIRPRWRTGPPSKRWSCWRPHQNWR